MSKYPKAFEKFYSNADTYIGNFAPYISARVKRIAYNSWMAGRRHQQKGLNK